MTTENGPITAAQITSAGNTLTRTESVDRDKKDNWTNNRLGVGVFFCLLTAVGSLWTMYLTFNGRLSAVEHFGEQLSTLKSDMAKATAEVQNLKTDVVRLTDKTAKLDDLRVSQEKLSSESSVVLQKTSDHIAEIDSLRAKVGAIEVTDGKFETAINNTSAKVIALENALNNSCATITSLRERVSKLEAKSKE